MSENVLKRLNKYEVRTEVAHGSMGTVYIGYDSFIDREVAIKVAHNESVTGGSHAAQNRRLFFNEAHTAGRLNHPNILSIYDAGIEGDNCYIIMEYVTGGNTLRPFCQPESLLPLDKVVEIVFKCAKALDYAHRKGVIHRDVKPGNILVTEDLDVKVADFSIAFLSEPEMTATQPLAVMGSPLYMSPEQIAESDIDTTSDLFSLGLIMYELLTGHHPFKSDKLATLIKRVTHDEPKPMRRYRPELPAPLEAIVSRALQKDPRDRFQSGLEFAAQLSRYADLGETEEELYSQERFSAVRQLDFFQDFSDAELWEILRAAAWHTYQPGEEVISEGQIDEAFYVIVSGSVLVRKGSKSIAILRTGDCFGEMGYIGKIKRTATILVTNVASIIKINATLIEQLSTDAQLRFHKVFLNTLVSRLARTSDLAIR